MMNFFDNLIKFLGWILFLILVMVLVAFTLSSDDVQIKGQQVCHTQKSWFSFENKKQCFELGKEATK